MSSAFYFTFFAAILNVAKVHSQVPASTGLAGLQACLGAKLTNQLVTPISSFSTNAYYQYNWLKSG